MSNQVTTAHKKVSPLRVLADRLGANDDAPAFISALRKVAFPKEGAGEVSDEQLLALVVVANQYGLNPFTRELYAFPAKGGGIVPILSIDGWSRIMNEQPSFDGVDFEEAPDGSWCECIIYRKDRQHPTRVREWLSECQRGTDPWKKWPRRMLRHKAMIQAARIAFGFAGVYDPDEGGRILEGEVVQPAVETTTAAPASRTEQAKAAIAARRGRAAATDAQVEPAPAPEPEPPPAQDPGAADWLREAGLGEEPPAK